MTGDRGERGFVFTRFDDDDMAMIMNSLIWLIWPIEELPKGSHSIE